jgi:hypothetical protein
MMLCSATTNDLRSLQATLDRCGAKLANVPPLPCGDSKALRWIADGVDEVLEKIAAISNRLEVEASKQKLDSPARIAAVGILLGIDGPVNDEPDDNLSRLDAELSGAWEPREDEHPVGVGAASESDPAVAELASIWTPGGAA